MKASPVAVLAGLCALLAAALAWLWVTPHGQLRDAVRWREPVGLTADYAAMGPGLPPIGEPDLRRFMMLLDRPLFSMTRRPPEPLPVAPPAEAAPDRLTKARLRAIIDGPDAGGGIILEVEGKSHRIQKRSVFEGWTLESLNTEARTATMTRRGQTRVLTLQRGQLSAGAARPRAGSARVPQPRAVAPAPVPTTRAATRTSEVPAAAKATEAPPPAGAGPAPPTFGGTRR